MVVDFPTRDMALVCSCQSVLFDSSFYKLCSPAQQTVNTYSLAILSPTEVNIPVQNMKKTKIQLYLPYLIIALLLMLLLSPVLTAEFLQSSQPVPTETYSYDAAGRLIQVTYGDGYRINYSYDNNGNILSKTITRGGPVFSDGFEQ
jgi:YD repeat-containing protein